MKEKLISRLFALQMKLKYIRRYNGENGSTLFKYSIEFEALLGLMLSFNYDKFKAIYKDYSLQTQRLCELGCEFNDEHNKEKAFLKGINEMDVYIKECLKILTA